MLIRPQFGYVPQPKKAEKLVRDMPYNLYGNYAKDYKERDTFLYKAMMKALPNYKRGAQAIGSCVGWGWALGVLMRSAIESLIYGEGEEVHGRISEAAIYGFSRVEVAGVSFAGWGDGSYGAAAAEAVRKYGNLYYDDYTSISKSKYADHRTYSGDREKNWGAYGVPNDLEATAKKYTIKTTSLVRNFDELAAAMVNDLAPIPVCSNQGFTMTRDSDGFCRASGSWSHCYPKNTMVYGENTKPIEDINIGDLVIGHDGELHKVTNTMNRIYNDDMIQIKPFGLPTISLTKEHPIFVRRNGIYAFINAEDVKITDYLVSPKLKVLPNKTKLTFNNIEISPDKDLSWLFGLYIADGNIVKNHKVCITIDSREKESIDKVVKIFNEKFGLKCHIYDKNTFVRLVVYSSELSRLFGEWFNRYSAIKRIPSFMYEEGWSLENLIDGIFCGDGCNIRGGKRLRITTISKRLAYDIWRILLYINKYPTMSVLPPSKTGYPNGKPQYIVEWVPNPIRKSKIIVDGNDILLPIKSISKTSFNDIVYNIEVDGVNSYVADGTSTHNCMLFGGVRFGRRPGALCINSWGDSNDGPHYPLDMPEAIKRCSFWVDANIVDRMLRGEDSFAISGFEGWTRLTPPDFMYL